MSDKIGIIDQAATSEYNPVNSDPDCLKCMRKKLRAICVVVFFKDESGWRLDRFEGDKPRAAAEAEFEYMLKAGVPEAVAGMGRPVCLEDQSEIANLFPKLKDYFSRNAVIAAPVQYGKSIGVRVAWREQNDPFSSTEAGLIECLGICPDGCAPNM